MAVPYTVNLAGGGQIVVNANSPQAALENAGNPAGATVSAGSYTGGGGSSSGGGTSAQPSGGSAAGSSLDAQFQKMLGALASGNREAFEWEKDKFNRQFAESVRQFDLGRSDELARFSQQFGLAVGELTGLYNGQPTESRRRFDEEMGENRRQFDVNTGERRADRYGTLGTSLLNAATQIRGPRDYLQYQQFTRGGQNLMQQLFGNNAVPQFGAPTGQLQSADLGSVLQDLGLLNFGAPAPAPVAAYDPRAALPAPAPTAYPGEDVARAYDGVFPGEGWNRGMAPEQVAAERNRNAILSRFGATAGQTIMPHQINPARWDAMGQIGRDLTKNLAETAWGYDAEDFERQINATRPVGTAPRRVTTRYARPSGLY